MTLAAIVSTAVALVAFIVSLLRIVFPPIDARGGFVLVLSVYPIGNKKSKRSGFKVCPQTRAAGGGVALEECKVFGRYLPASAHLPATNFPGLGQLA